MNHYGQHFSSNLITVVIKSDRSVDTIQDLILDSDLKKLNNKNLLIEVYDADGKNHIYIHSDLPLID